jgi:4-amino-4-deoxy-L-arabinose transferase-like glycosyltransferase
VVNNGRWFSQYTPGHALLLAVGDRAGAPWLVNPVLGALTISALYLLGREVYGRGAATVAVLLLAVSPFFVLMSSEYYSHATSLLFLILFLYQYARVLSAGGTWPALAAGACLGVAMFARPLSALAVALPCAAHALVMISRDIDGARLRRLGLIALVTLGFVGLILAYNRATTGALLTFGYAQADGLQFGLGGRSDWFRAFSRVIALNNDLLGWPIPALTLAAAAFFAARPSQWDYLFAAIFASLCGAYGPTGYPDREFGPRYLYEAIGPLLLLSARGLSVLPEAVGRFAVTPPSVAAVRSVAGVGVLLALVFAGAFSWPTRLGFYGSPAWRWAYPHEAALRVRAADLDQALVFVRGEPLWRALFLENPLPWTDRARAIYARDRGAENGQLMAQYPHRRYFIADVTGVRPLLPE